MAWQCGIKNARRVKNATNSARLRVGVLPYTVFEIPAHRLDLNATIGCDFRDAPAMGNSDRNFRLGYPSLVNRPNDLDGLIEVAGRCAQVDGIGRSRLSS
jgi:hypothetical protein